MNPNRKLLEHQFKPAEYERRDMIAYPEPGTTFEEMKSPAYWANVARTVRRWDRIEVRPEDGRWWAELLVKAVEPFAVVVHVLRYENLSKVETPPAAADQEYAVIHRGKRNWCVMRTTDNQELKSGEPSEEHAHLWLKLHLQQLAA